MEAILRIRKVSPESVSIDENRFDEYELSGRSSVTAGLMPEVPTPPVRSSAAAITL
jgi:hypothetical protein